VISITAHVILIAVMSVIYVSHHRRKEAELPTVVALAPRVEEAPKIEEPEVIKRNEIPRPEDMPESETPSPDTPFVENMPPGNWDEDMDPNNPRVGDPTALIPMPTEGMAGGTAIGVGNQGHYGLGRPSPWATRTLGGMGGRRAGSRSKAMRQHGADETNQEHVEFGLEWLKNHQVPDEGYWDCDNFQAQCKKNICEGKGYSLYDPGVTGLALLAFLGAGYTHKEGRYKRTVADAIRYLRKIQDPEGCFGGRQEQHFVYSHAICTLALAEAYALTETALLKPAVEKGLEFIYACQNPHPSGTGFLAWRYGVRTGQNDSSVTGWMIMALKSAYEGKFALNKPSVEGAKAFLDSVTEPATGKVGYTQMGLSPVRQTGRETRWPPEKSEAITAVGVFARIFANSMLGIDSQKDPLVLKGAQLMASKLPNWNENDGSIDQYYWYYGTLAMFQVGGEYWKKWNGAMKEAIIKHQRTSGDEKGSWDPLDPWAEDGGRVYSTALMTMCLEVYYRYGKVFGTR
jgi:hypothetical protein